MPRPGARGGVAHPGQQVVAAGDELLEESRGSGEQLLDDERRIVVHHREARLFESRQGHVGEAHCSTLPARRALRARATAALMLCA